MKHDSGDALQSQSFGDQPDASSDVRIFAAWMGLVIVAFGVAMAGYLMFHIGSVVLDPRSFETQVDRWEFVIRGRTTDAFPEAYETPERRIISPNNADPDELDGAADGDLPPEGREAAPVASVDQTEEMARFVGRVGSKSARPAALMLVTVLLLLLVRIIIAIIHAGIRMVYLTAGEKDFMKRILAELSRDRKHPE